MIVNELINVDEASNYLKVSKSYIYKKTSSKSIIYYRIGKHIFFDKNDLKEFVEKKLKIEKIE
ncbi:excisionase family DNA-binding protein [Spirochaeta dissipatitropha]